jgi:hypothetical protein
MINIATNYSLTHRSIYLARVLWFGIPWLRSSFIALVCMWALVALVDHASSSVGLVAAVVAFPVMLQLILVMFIAIRASQLLMNPQLHLIDVRREIFINCLSACLLFCIFIYDPKSADNLLNAKLIMFAVFSTSCFWLIWIYSLQILSMFIVGLIFVGSLWIGYEFGVKIALFVFNISVWGYFAFWLAHSPLQRQFKFESFAGLVDYFVERLRLTRLKYVITKACNKDHVLLMGEGDGYINRIFLAHLFSLLFTLFYILAMRNLRDLCLWMILLVLAGTKARLKVTQSQAKLWLLHDGNRADQFSITENILLRLTLYSSVAAFMLLMLWSYINPDFMVHGVGAFFLSLLFVIALDYYSGFIFPGAKFSLIIFLLIKMAFMFVMVYVHIYFVWYMVLAVVLFGICMLVRRRAKRNFLMANLSVRAI